jgi:hypothetical protein
VASALTEVQTILIMVCASVESSAVGSACAGWETSKRTIAKSIPLCQNKI